VLITRVDDNEASTKKRLEIYHSETVPLIDYYKKKGILRIVAGNKEPEDVFKDIKEQLVFG
jgi:adenylate kinase